MKTKILQCGFVQSNKVCGPSLPKHNHSEGGKKKIPPGAVRESKVLLN